MREYDEMIENEWKWEGKEELLQVFEVGKERIRKLCEKIGVEIEMRDVRDWRVCGICGEGKGREIRLVRSSKMEEGRGLRLLLLRERKNDWSEIENGLTF